MGSKGGNGAIYRQACEYRKEGCPFVSEICKTEQCGFYYRVQADSSVEETIEELRLLGVSEKNIKSLEGISHAAEFRKQAFFRFYQPWG